MIVKRHLVFFVSSVRTMDPTQFDSCKMIIFVSKQKHFSSVDSSRTTAKIEIQELVRCWEMVKPCIVADIAIGVYHVISATTPLRFKRILPSANEISFVIIVIIKNDSSIVLW